MNASAKDRYLINSILRACSILKSFSGENSHFKMSDLARRLQLDRSTAYRILLSLERAGFVEKNEEAGTYSLGLAAFEIGNAYLGQTDLIQVSKPAMADLSAKVQETVHLAVLSDLEIVYIDKVDSPRPLGVMSKLGQRGPLHCTSLGKSLLAFQPEEEQNRILQKIKMPPLTPRTITTKRKLIEELRTVKKQGYALDRREIEEDVECIGAPIFNYLGNVIAALSISGPQKKIGTPQEKHFIQSVVKAASLISSRMGYRPPQETGGKR
jgi:IclR family transcriptional regulator, KDG regulon repressor